MPTDNRFVWLRASNVNVVIPIRQLTDQTGASASCQRGSIPLFGFGIDNLECPGATYH
jgi:hypothetical protein